MRRLLLCSLAVLALAAVPRTPQQLYEDARAAYGRKDYPAYVTAMEALAALRPQHPIAIGGYAGALALNNRGGEAVAQLQRLLAMHVAPDLSDHDLDGIRTVGLVNADCPCSTNPMAVQEDHDLAHDLLLSPGIGDPFGADRANTRHLAQAIRLSLDRVKHLLTESTHKLFCVDRADASDHAGAQVLLDTVDRRWREGTAS